MFIFASTAVAPVWAAYLKDANLAVMPNQTRIIFDLNGSVQYKIFQIPKSSGKSARLVIDMHASRTSSAFRKKRFRRGFVTKIRSAIHRQNGLRVVLDLDRNIQYRHFTLTPLGRYGHRLVVDLYKRGSRIPSQYKRQAPVQYHQNIGKARSSSKQDKIRIIGLRKINRSQQSRRSVKVNTTGKRRLRKQDRHLILPPIKTREVIIAIDAGHGGQDPGAIGLYGTREKDIVLKMAKSLQRLVRKTPGMRAVMIRQGDYFISLRGRMALARKHRADLFISIHADAAKRRSASGVSVYTLSRRGASSQAARWLARRENRSDIIGGVKIHKHDKNLAKVLLDLSQTSTNKASEDLANTVLRALSRISPVHGRGRGRAGFVVLKSPDVPSILVETGFISNPKEESRLRRHRYRKQIAAMLLQGIIKYFIKNAPPDTIFAKRKHIIAKGESLRDIAKRYQVSLSVLKRTNGLRSNRAHIGRVLNIPRTLAMSFGQKHSSRRRYR